ncbi:MAG: nucleoside hydrolase [Bacteroidales bacterium]
MKIPRFLRFGVPGRIPVLLLFLAIVPVNLSSLFAHSGKPKYHVVIDTDGAIDDLRALALFLAGNDIRVLAITTSQGSLGPEETAAKVRELLAQLHHEGIPVGVGDSLDRDLPSWASFSRDVPWGIGGAGAPVPKAPGSAVELLTELLAGYPQMVTLVALGSLKTYADVLTRHPGLVGNVERILWYNEDPIETGFNHGCAPEATATLLALGIPVHMVGNSSTAYPVDAAYLDAVKDADSPYGQVIASAHEHPAVRDRLAVQHLQLWDDLLPLYLTAPLLFDKAERSGYTAVSLNPGVPAEFLSSAIRQLLRSSREANNRVFGSFPLDSSLYLPAYAGILGETVRRFGAVEWKAICLTNEIHGHTGIYSIVGAKAGIRAMEYFHVGVNNLEVVSHAGSNPPVSCFNDGLQIGTGSTIGQGLITLLPGDTPVAVADFYFLDRGIRLSVKPEIARQMREEIAEGVARYGALTDPYWRYVEDLAIRYWSQMDRNEIFLIEVLDPPAPDQS